jgi:hypothetical protein
MTPISPKMKGAAITGEKGCTFNFEMTNIIAIIVMINTMIRGKLVIIASGLVWRFVCF